jgi:probable HAF family extracellular repeat protein
MCKHAMCVLALLLVPGLAGAASFTPLGFLNGVNNSHASGVSADGSVVVGSSYSARGPQAFRWTGGVITGLGALPGDAASAANGVSADGTVVVGTSIYVPADSFYEAFQWTAMTGLRGFPGAPPCNSLAFGVSADGAVVVGQCNREAFRWTGGVMTGLGVLPGDIESVANGVSADGAVVVGRSDGKAFRWTGGVMTGLGALPFGTYTEAFGVSADGTTVVGSSHIGTGYEAFQWLGGVMTGLGVLAGDTDSVAYGASDTGLVVGRSYAIVQGELRGQAFVWTPWDDMSRLEDVLAANGATGLAGWTLEEAHGISADGLWIVGTGINPNGDREAFLANVSTGPPSVAVPNVVGQTQAAATTAITGAGLTVGTVTSQPSSTVAAGSVISESPAVGTSVSSGSAVNLVLSTGRVSSGGGGGATGFDLLALLGLLNAFAMRKRRRLARG